MNALELQNLIMSVNASTAIHLSDKYFDTDFLHNFVNCFLDPKDNKQLYYRLFQYEVSNSEFIDQINEVIEKVEENMVFKKMRS